MKTILTYFLFISIFLSKSIFADTDLIDPITKKTISYNTTSQKEKSFKLNAFEDIEMLLPVFKKNTVCSENIKIYLKNLLRDEAYINRFKNHTKLSLTNFVTYSEFKNTLSVSDKRRIFDQNVELDEIEARLVSFYNNLICIKIEAQYKLNQGYDDRFGESSSMCHTIYMDVNTGKISNLIDFCPQRLQKNFINYLTNEKNKLLPNLKLTIDKEEKDLEEEENEDEYINKQENKNSKNDSLLSFEKLNLTDIVFDVNAFQFSVIKNSSNTTYTHGKPFIINVSEDSMKHFISWIVSAINVNPITSIKASEMNSKLLYYSYQNPYNFFYQPELKQYFENTRNKSKVEISYRQNFIQDTAFKLQQKLRFNSDNTISEIASNFDLKTNQPQLIKTFIYETGNIKKIVEYNARVLNEEHSFSYNNTGFLVKYISKPNDEHETEHTYKYENNLVHECITNEGETSCYTYVFDSSGNQISRSIKGQKQSYISTYSNSLLMAIGDALYSYNSDNQIIAMERDRGRYYTNYYYDKQKRLIETLMFDGKDLVSKDEVLYDSKSRIVMVTHTSSSYGKVQTQIQHKISYDN